MSPALRAEARQVLGREDIALAWEPILVDPPRSAVGRSRGPIVVVGRLEPQKNIALALEAFARSRASATVELLILGEGSERAALLRCAHQLGIADRVRMPGHCTDVMAALATASLLLLTSRYEGYPAVLVEAMAVGIPIVATRCSPAIEEILGDDPRGAIVDADATRIAAALDAVILRSAADRARPPERLAIARHSVGDAAAGYLKVLDAARAMTLRDVAAAPARSWLAAALPAGWGRRGADAERDTPSVSRGRGHVESLARLLIWGQRDCGDRP